MIILFGLRRRIHRLGTAFFLCPYCQTPAAQAVTRVRRYFTLFFIPVIPLGGKYVVTCTMCGRATQVAQQTAESYVASAQPPDVRVGTPVPLGQPAPVVEPGTPPGAEPGEIDPTGGA